MKPWHKLDKKQQDRLLGLLMSLEEFSYGFDQSGLASLVSETGSAAQRFYSNSIYQYFANMFLVSGSHRTWDFLRQVGSEDLLESIESILRYEVGNVTLEFIIKAFRNRQLVHTSFSSDQLERYLKEHMDPKTDLSDAQTVDSLTVWIFDLFSRTRDLYENLSGRYPEAYSEHLPGR